MPEEGQITHWVGTLTELDARGNVVDPAEHAEKTPSKSGLLGLIQQVMLTYNSQRLLAHSRGARQVHGVHSRLSDKLAMVQQEKGISDEEVIDTCLIW